MDGLYDRDIVIWTQDTADKLRRMRKGERVNDLDWDNLIEEVEALGRSETRAAARYIELALLHLLKMAAWPNSTAYSHWREEVSNFLQSAQDCFTPGMRQKIDVPRIYERALHQMRRYIFHGEYPAPVCDLPTGCPFTLDDLLVEFAEVETLKSRLG